MAEEVVNRQGDLSLHIFHKWKDTNLGNVLAPVLAFVIEYPIATLFIAVFMGLSALPLVLFVSFVLYSFLFTMLGFAMVEGTLLMIAVSMLSAVIFFAFFVSICITAFLIFTWSSAAVGYTFVQKLKGIVLYFFPSLKEILENYAAVERSRSDWILFCHGITFDCCQKLIFKVICSTWLLFKGKYCSFIHSIIIMVF